MFHHPNCPYYRQTPPCVYSCQLLQHGQSMQLTQPTQTIQPQYNNLYTPLTLESSSQRHITLDPVDTTTTLIQQGFSRAANRLDDLHQLCDERAERRVRFNTPAGQKQRRVTLSNDGAYDDLAYEREIDRTSRRSIQSLTTSITCDPDPPQDHVLRSILRPVAKVIRDHKTPSLGIPTIPTVYIVTFSTDATLHRSKNVSRLIETQIPMRNPPIPHLYTIDARDYMPPSARVCERYSGISPVVQDIVMQDRKARHAVKHAVQELLAFGLREREKERGKREVSMSVCCHAGTHRSVAIGERIAQGVKAEVGKLGLEEGVRVVVRHVHRMKGRGDPF
jgi:predicted protein tyrosine phosphatase